MLLAYNGKALNKKEDLQTVAKSDKPIGLDFWRSGRLLRREVAAGKLGVVLDSRPAREAIAGRRKLDRVLLVSRGGSADFSPLPATRYEVDAIAQLFRLAGRPARTLLGSEAGEIQIDRLAESGELAHCGFIHMATHGVIDDAVPARSAVILTQVGLPDSLDQILSQKPVFDGRLSVREIQREWELKAELVTLSACETALGRQAGGEGFVGFTQALLMSGRAACVCRSGRSTTRQPPFSCSDSTPICSAGDKGSKVRCPRRRLFAKRRSGFAGSAAANCSRWPRISQAEPSAARVPSLARVAILPPRLRPEGTTIGLMPIPTTGRRSCSAATRIDARFRFGRRTSPDELLERDWDRWRNQGGA